MRSIRSLLATFSVGLVLAVITHSGAVPWLSCIRCETSRVMVESYQSAARVYQTARTWSSVARLWMDPQASAATR
jgi:hypothetical protein